MKFTRKISMFLSVLMIVTFVTAPAYAEDLAIRMNASVFFMMIFLS